MSTFVDERRLRLENEQVISELRTKIEGLEIENRNLQNKVWAQQVKFQTTDNFIQRVQELDAVKDAARIVLNVPHEGFQAAFQYLKLVIMQDDRASEGRPEQAAQGPNPADGV